MHEAFHGGYTPSRFDTSIDPTLLAYGTSALLAYSTRGTWLPVLGPAVDDAVQPGVVALETAPVLVAAVRQRRRAGPVRRGGRAARHAGKLLGGGTRAYARRHRHGVAAAQRNFAPATTLRGR